MITGKAAIFWYLSAISMILLLAQGCSYKGRNAILKTPFDTDTVKNVFVVNDKADHEGYYNKIQPEDELAISNLQDISLLVKGNSEVNNQGNSSYTTFRVKANGSVLLPIIGDVKVSGLNRIEAAAEIQKAYEAKELKKPLIDVRISNQYVLLMGDVGRQGKFVITREDYELIDLLGDAGGLLPTANKKMVKIFRGDRANPEIIIVNMEDYAFLKNNKLKLQSKDIVYVEPKRVVANAQNVQAYSTLLQVGLVAISTILLIINLSK